MAQQTITIGASANDGTGDTWRDAMDKSNDNFDELYAFDATINTVFIAQESDFPTQDASTITLDALTVFVVSGTFTTAKKFTCNNGSVLTANNQFGHSITYSGVGSMFTGLDANFTIRDITVSCPTAQVFDFSETVGGTTIFLCINIVVTACTKWGTYDEMLAVDISGSNSQNVADGVTLVGTSTLVFSLRQFALISSSATFKGIDLGSAVSANIEGVNLVFVAPAGAFGISGLASSGNVPVGSVAMITSSSFIGGITDLQNITTDDIRWRFRDNSPTQDTFEDALLSFRNNAIETTITASSTDGSNAVIVDATWVEQRASFFTTTAAGRATYNGERDLTAPITISAGLISSGGGAIDVTLYLAIDGAVIVASGVPISISGSNAQTLSIPWQEELALDQSAEIFVENNTNTTNIIVEHATMRIR